MNIHSENTVNKEYKRILYFSCVAWGWIKQRPQFIAEGLAKNYLVDYCYVSGLKRFDSVMNKFNSGNLKIKRIFKPPLLYYFSQLNIVLLTLQLKVKMRKYDILWINGRCELFEKFFNELSKKPRIIYDCLDDMLEFPVPKNNLKVKEKIAAGEKNITKNAELIFCSSEYLINKIKRRHNINKNVSLVNNAINISSYKKEPIPKSVSINKSFVITYIGTISEWFDFESLMLTLEKYSDIEYHLYGVKDTKIPVHKNIKYKGTLEHSEIFNIMAFSDALIMPFKLNELIRSVDPVKIYEYIYSGRPVIAILYEGTKKFKPYAYLYKDQNELDEFINDLRHKRLKIKLSEQDRIKFGEENCWEKRLDIINNKIKLLSF